MSLTSWKFGAEAAPEGKPAAAASAPKLDDAKLTQFLDMKKARPEVSDQTLLDVQSAQEASLSQLC